MSQSSTKISHREPMLMGGFVSFAGCAVEEDNIAKRKNAARKVQWSLELFSQGAAVGIIKLLSEVRTIVSFEGWPCGRNKGGRDLRGNAIGFFSL